MLIVYYSFTGNVESFVNRYLTEFKTKSISDGNVSEPFILITPTYGFGDIPETVSEWLRKNNEYMAGVIGSGQRNWGKNYCNAAKTVSKMYHVPLIATFELRGTTAEAMIVTERLKEYYKEVVK